MPGDGQRSPAIAGLGITELGKVYGRTAPQFAAQAVRLAAEDAGLELGAIDGLIVSGGLSGTIGLGMQSELGLTDLGRSSRSSATRPPPRSSTAASAASCSSSATGAPATTTNPTSTSRPIPTA